MGTQDSFGRDVKAGMTDLLKEVWPMYLVALVVSVGSLALVVWIAALIIKSVFGG